MKSIISFLTLETKRSNRSLLLKSNLFDTDYYCKKVGIKSNKRSAVRHYLSNTLNDRVSPSKFYSIRYYLGNNEDVKAAGIDPFIHFLKHGAREFRRPHSNFDLDKFIHDFGHLINQNENFLEKFIFLLNERVITSSQYFSTKKAPPVNTKTSTFNKTSLAFDSNYYLEKNPDVASSDIEPEWHYYTYGEKEGRKPNTFFDPVFYYDINADVRVAGLSAFRHYRDNGFKEGRLGQPPLQQEKLSSSHKKPLLFIVHDGIQAGSQTVLLEILKWFSCHTTRRVKLLLLNSGPIANKYAFYADVYVLSDYKVDEQEKLGVFLNEQFEFIYLNTVVSGRIFQIIAPFSFKLQGPIIVHIHEMEKVLSEYKEEMHLLKKNAQGWISASPTTSDTLVKNYYIPPQKITTVPAFIRPVCDENSSHGSFKKDAREKLELNKNAFIVFGCGTVYPRKGPDIFIETARKVNTQTSIAIEFVWLGDGPDRLEILSKLSQEEKKYIKFVGACSGANKLLAGADVFFLSSREDPFPLVVLETAQYAIPTVLFGPATGITTFVDSNAGITLPKIDANDAAKVILKLYEDPSFCEKIGDNAKKRLFANYTTLHQNLKIFDSIKKITDYQPSVSVIVPFYNHEKFLNERFESILGQSIKDIEIIALDDCSTDDSLKTIEPYLSDLRVSLFTNICNSGSPFKQWEKGVSQAKAELVWIAEGDDSCEQNFLEILVPYFDDPMVNIAGAKAEIIDTNGHVKQNALNPYLEMAFPAKFETSYIKDGFLEVNEQFGAMCTLVNASGVILRKSSLKEDSLRDAQRYTIAGDWLIYLNCLQGGKIAYDINTTNYFRRHANSQVNKVEGTDIYFKERQLITDHVVRNYFISQRSLRKAFDAIDHEWERFSYMHPEKSLKDLYDKDKILKNFKSLKKQPHVAFYVHGLTFSKGGIERLATQLANHLVERGWKITIYCQEHVQKNPVYPVYQSVAIKPVFDEHRLEMSIKQLRKHLIRDNVEIFVPMLSEWLFEPIIDATKNTGVYVIASEHNDPWEIEKQWWTHEQRVKYFKKVDCIHLLLEKFKHSLPEELHYKIAVIPNGVHVPEKSFLDKQEKLILGVGRLEPQKRFDRLVDAVALIQNELREEKYRVEIYGQGSLYDELQNQIKKLGISDLINLKGETAMIEKVYSKAVFIVLPSEFEGLSIVLLEAFSMGLPAIGFRDCDGLNEIIRQNIDGILVDSVEELAHAVIDLCRKDDLTTYRKNALKQAQKYSIESFYAKWREVLTSPYIEN